MKKNMGIAGYRQENRMETEDITKDSVKEFRDKLLSFQEEKCNAALKAGDKAQIIYSFGELVNISTHYNLLGEGKTEKEEILKRASDLFRKIAGKEEYKDLFNLICPDEVTEKSFTEGVLYEWRKLRENFTVYPYPCTLEFLREAASDVSDQAIIQYFDFSEYENSEKPMLGAVGLNVLMSVYRARPSETLKEGIDAFILKSRNLDKFTDEAWEIAKNVAIDVTWKLSDPNMDVFRYLFERSGCKDPDKDRICSLKVSYPDTITEGNGRVNRKIGSEGIGYFIDNEVPIMRSQENRNEVDGVFRFRFGVSVTGLEDPYISPENMEKLKNINRDLYEVIKEESAKLNEKYKDFIGEKSSFMVEVVNAIGACMCFSDKSFTCEAVRKFDRKTVKEPVIITPEMIFKYIRGDKKARLQTDIKKDIMTALYFCNSLWVEISDIRGASKDYIIRERVLDFDHVTAIVQGNKTEAYEFTKVPSLFRYNMINGDVTKRAFINRNETQQALPEQETRTQNRTKEQRARIRVFLQRWISRYSRKDRGAISYSFDKLLEDAEIISPDFNIQATDKRKQKQRLYERIEAATKDLRDSGVIEGYEIEVEREGNRALKKLVIYPLKKEGKKEEKTVVSHA